MVSSASIGLPFSSSSEKELRQLSVASRSVGAANRDASLCSVTLTRMRPSAIVGGASTAIERSSNAARAGQRNRDGAATSRCSRSRGWARAPSSLRPLHRLLDRGPVRPSFLSQPRLQAEPRVADPSAERSAGNVECGCGEQQCVAEFRWQSADLLLHALDELRRVDARLR